MKVKLLRVESPAPGLLDPQSDVAVAFSTYFGRSSTSVLDDLPVTANGRGRAAHSPVLRLGAAVRAMTPHHPPSVSSPFRPTRPCLICPSLACALAAGEDGQRPRGHFSSAHRNVLPNPHPARFPFPSPGGARGGWQLAGELTPKAERGTKKLALPTSLTNTALAWLSPPRRARLTPPLAPGFIAPDSRVDTFNPEPAESGR